MCTPSTFSDSEGTYDDDDEMIEESVVISIDDADEYIALYHQVERGLTFLMKTWRNAETIFS